MASAPISTAIIKLDLNLDTQEFETLAVFAI